MNETVIFSPGTIRVWIIAGVLSPVLSPGQRVAHRLAQQPRLVGLGHGRLDRRVEFAAHKGDFLAEIDEHDRGARVLAGRQARPLGLGDVLGDGLQNLAPQFR